MSLLHRRPPWVKKIPKKMLRLPLAERPMHTQWERYFISIVHQQYMFSDVACPCAKCSYARNNPT